MKKKWLALIITIMATCCFCACGAGTVGDGSGSTASTEQGSSPIEGDSSPTDDSTPDESESGTNGGKLEGDNDLNWEDSQK